MRKSIPVAIIVVIILFFSATAALADSSYVLPYPSNMPGSKWYVLDQLQERVSKYWYFGDFASFTYNLYYADKYLVEAKTLFEYNQFLLAVGALEKSDVYFQKHEADLRRAQNKGRNISEKRTISENASQKHSEVILAILESTPATFNWTPEKDPSTQLDIHQRLKKSLQLRSL